MIDKNIPFISPLGHAYRPGTWPAMSHRTSTLRGPVACCAAKTQFPAWSRQTRSAIFAATNCRCPGGVISVGEMRSAPARKRRLPRNERMAMADRK